MLHIDSELIQGWVYKQIASYFAYATTQNFLRKSYTNSIKDHFRDKLECVF